MRMLLTKCVLLGVCLSCQREGPPNSTVKEANSPWAGSIAEDDLPRPPADETPPVAGPKSLAELCDLLKRLSSGMSEDEVQQTLKLDDLGIGTGHGGRFVFHPELALDVTLTLHFDVNRGPAPDLEERLEFTDAVVQPKYDNDELE